MTEEFTGKVIADKYEVETLIRRGEVGDLYRARHLFMDKPVTLKVVSRERALDAGITRRFFHEAKVASQFSHPNVLTATDFGSTADETVYSVYQGEGGVTLSEFLSPARQLDPATAVEISRQAAAGLSAVHAYGVIHGNLGTENILVREDGDGSLRIKVLDFDSKGPMASERSGEALGPNDLAYLSPEQCSGSDDPDERSDIYSLGVIVYEMLAGAVPFGGERASDVIMKHGEEPPPPLSAYRSDLPAWIEPVVLKALAKDPGLRQQTAIEFAGELESGLHEEPAGELNVAVAAAGGNNLWKTAFVVLAGISLLSAFLIYSTTSRRTDPTTSLQPDVNSQPVQPINPATGAEEQSLALLPAVTDLNGNSNMAQPPGTLPGGDGYNPWGNGGVPPPGAPAYVPPGGKVYTIDPNTGSPFMPAEGGVVLVPVPANSNTAVKPSPTPRPPASNSLANTAGVPKPTPEAKPSQPRATPTPRTATSPVAKKPEGGPQDPDQPTR
ncbi:MAG: protein kinase [Acidobacteriota bacterium]